MSKREFQKAVVGTMLFGLLMGVPAVVLIQTEVVQFWIKVMLVFGGVIFWFVCAMACVRLMRWKGVVVPPTVYPARPDLNTNDFWKHQEASRAFTAPERRS